MCGIAGIICLESHVPDDERIHRVEAMIRTLEHRGPDSKGIVDLDGVVLGACRLAILGLESSSNQPLRSPDSDCTVVFNGEIYNYIELREELVALGHRFQSTGDTEVVVHAFEEWGETCVSRFNGMFALAIHDSTRKLSFIARDRFGVKPVYFSGSEGMLLFGSEPRALLLAKGGQWRLNEHATIDYLKFGVTDVGRRSFFEGIDQLPPGHSLRISGKEVLESAWYTLARQEHQRTAAQLIDFRTAFMDSVRIRMRSDVPVGILLSGGLDSSSILAAASRLFPPEELTAFTVSFPGTAFDESTFARSAASREGVPVRVEEAERLDVESVRRCIKDQQEPFISPSVIAQWLVMKAVKRDAIKVLLSGQGSDEYLAGYEYFDAYAVIDFLKHAQLSAALHHLLHERNSHRLVQILAETLFLALPSRLKELAWRKDWLRDEHHSLHVCEYYREFVRNNDLQGALTFHVKYRLPELLRYEDRNSMASSIETRHPFLDYRIVETAFSVPPTRLVGVGRRKRLLTDALEDILDPVVLARRDKAGFGTPTEWLHSAGFAESLRNLIAQAPDALKLLIDFDAVSSLLGKAIRRREVNDLWRIYNLLAWYQACVAEYGAPFNLRDAPHQGSLAGPG